MSKEQIRGEVLDHLGIVAATIKKIKYHKVNFEITEVIPKKKRSKNAIENPADNIHYRIHGIIEKDEASIAIAQHEKGRFILATNELDDNKLSDFDILPLDSAVFKSNDKALFAM